MKKECMSSSIEMDLVSDEENLDKKPAAKKIHVRVAMDVGSPKKTRIKCSFRHSSVLSSCISVVWLFGGCVVHGVPFFIFLKLNG